MPTVSSVSKVAAATIVQPKYQRCCGFSCTSFSPDVLPEWL
jgi:hypothetical protein